MAVRRFEHDDRFWEIAMRLDDTLSITWGPKSERGQSRIVPGGAAKAEQLIAKQVALGYVEQRAAHELLATLPHSTERWYRKLAHPNGTWLAFAIAGRRAWKWSSDFADDKPERTEHTDTDEARDLLSRAIHRAVNDGYRNVPTAVDPKLAVKPEPVRCVDDPALEAECRAAPNDPEPWLVYTDWLMQHGDPRGEMAALQRATGEVTYDPLVFGKVLVEAPPDILAWRHGFAAAVSLRTTYDESATKKGSLVRRTQEFLDHPISTFVDDFRFGVTSFDSRNDWGPIVERLVEWPNADHIRVVRFDEFAYQDQEISWVNPGNLSRLWQLPNLEDVRIHGGGKCTLGPIVAPQLKVFVRKSGGLPADQVREIVAARWPQLEHLELWFGRADYGAGGDAEMIAPILRGVGLPELRHLGIVNCEFTLSVIEMLLASKLLRQLRSLDLSNGIMWNPEYELLIANADKLRHLETIEISDNYLRADQVRALHTALPAIVSNRQRDDGEAPEIDEDPDEEWRYAALGE